MTGGDPRDRSDALVVGYRPNGRSKHRLVFEPHSEGGFSLLKQQFEGGRWRTTGTERVQDLWLEPPDPEEAGEVLAGP